MKVFNFRKIVIISLIILIFFLFIIGITNKAFGMQNYYKLDFVTGLVTASTLNVRSGPGTNYNVIATVNKNEYVRVFAGIGNWYIIQTPTDYVGAVSSKYIKEIYPNTVNSNNSVNTNSDSSNVVSLTKDEQEVFDLINQQRVNKGLKALKIDKNLQEVARIKAKDMVDNNYFSHNSPIYGTPFEMMKSFKIDYKSAGENIAGNSSNSAAVTAWMNSEGHRKNILTADFNYTGVAVVNGSKYGKIYVQMFIGK